VTAAPLKCFFYREPGKLNFGDDLSPVIVEYVSGRRCVYSEPHSADLAAIGSIIDIALKPRVTVFRSLAVKMLGRQRLPVWGSGILQPALISAKARSTSHLNFLAVRGKLTANLLSQKSVPLGEPGLFLGEYFQERKKSVRLGIVPHYVDAKLNSFSEFAKRFPKAKIINVRMEPLEVARQISECEIVLSSSLHGLVAADAFGIPNSRVKFSDALLGGDWKFNDYASAISRHDIAPINLSGDKIEEVVRSQDTAYWKNMPELLQKLRKSLII
jgi:pyruvyltransferase